MSQLEPKNSFLFLNGIPASKLNTFRVIEASMRTEFWRVYVAEKKHVQKFLSRRL
jgi:hypothetical protein